jgi:IS1 family transposase
MEKRLRWYWKPSMGYSWRVDETYVKVKGEWTYLYRALDKKGHTLDFYLSATRNTQAAKRFLGKALKSMKPWAHPGAINTDKAPAYRSAITELKAEGKCPPDTVHRQVKYLNNIIEADHGKLKRLINPVRGFKSMKRPMPPSKVSSSCGCSRKDSWTFGNWAKASQEKSGSLKGNSVSTGHNQSDHTHSFWLAFFLQQSHLFDH